MLSSHSPQTFSLTETGSDVVAANSFESLETMSMVQALNASVGKSSQLLLPMTTDEHLLEVKNALLSLKATVEEEGKASREADKMRRIEFALKNTSFVSKDCNFMLATKTINDYNFKYTSGPVDADKFLIDILMSFRKGTGHVIGDYYIDVSKSGATKFNTIKKENIEAFRNKLCDKLDRLLGSYPRFTFRPDGRVVLFYA